MSHYFFNMAREVEYEIMTEYLKKKNCFSKEKQWSQRDEDTLENELPIKHLPISN